MIRSRLVLAVTLAGLVLLAFAASAGAKPHKPKVGAGPSTVNAPKRPSLTVGKAAKLKVVGRGHGALGDQGVVLQAKPSRASR